MCPYIAVIDLATVQSMFLLSFIFVILVVVVYRSSETSNNQSDVIIRSDDRFLNLVVDSDSIVSKIYILNFVLWVVFFSVSILTKILQFYPIWFFLPSYWQTSGNFVQAYF